jgi:hypothetical protein
VSDFVITELVFVIARRNPADWRRIQVKITEALRRRERVVIRTPRMELRVLPGGQNVTIALPATPTIPQPQLPLWLERTSEE